MVDIDELKLSGHLILSLDAKLTEINLEIKIVIIVETLDSVRFSLICEGC